MTKREELARTVIDDLLEDEGDVEVFLDRKGRRIRKGDRVIFLGNQHQTENVGEVGTIEHLRFGYSKRFGFGSNQLPLVLVKLDNGGWGGEIHTSSVEKVL